MSQQRMPLFVFDVTWKQLSPPQKANAIKYATEKELMSLPSTIINFKHTGGVS